MKDITHGKPIQLILLFSIPVLLNSRYDDGRKITWSRSLAEMGVCH